MAVAVIKFSDQGRERLSLLFTIISLLLFIISIIIVFNSVYVTFGVAPNLQSEKAAIKLIFTVIGMLAMQMALYYLVGIVICRKCHIEAYKKHSRYMLRIWTFSGYSSIVNILVLGTMAAGVSNHLVRSMHHSMVRGMKRYLKDMNWKRIIDTLQYRLQCCGSHSFTDWHEISWMSASLVINTSEIIQNRYKLNGDRLYVPAVPWSCCRLDYSKQCFHDPIQQYQYEGNWPLLSTESVYNIGCVEVMRLPLENAFLLFILSTYIMLIFQIILTVTSRYLYTSYKNAVILGDPFGVSPGWLLGRGDFGIYRGPTVSEIMIGSRRTTTTPVSTVEEIPEKDSSTCSANSEHYLTPEDSDDEYRITTEDEEALMIK